MEVATHLEEFHGRAHHALYPCTVLLDDARGERTVVHADAYGYAVALAGRRERFYRLVRRLR